MNSFYKVTQYLRDFLSQDQDVNTITKGDVNKIDISKKNIFPLAHINPTSAPVGNQLTFVFEVSVLDIRNYSKEPSADKFLEQDNQYDILNTCHAVLNRLITRLRLLNDDDDITLLNEPTLLPIDEAYTNGLDGWFVELQISMPNRIRVC